MIKGNRQVLQTRVAVLLACVLLTACATTAGVFGLGQNTQSPEERAADCASSRDSPLARFASIRGILLGESRPGAGPAAQAQRVRLVSPVAVAAEANFVFIADAGQQVIFRFDRALQTVRVFAEVPGLNSRAGLYVDRGLSVYLADPGAGRIVQYNIDGQIVQTFENPTELTDPVTVAVDDGRAEVFGGDGLSARVLVFNRAGTISRAIGARTSGGVRFGSIASITLGTDQLYVADRLDRKVYALSAEGKLRYEFGNEELTQPGAMSADDYNRVYVADNGDNTIKVYRGGRYETVVGAPDDESGLGFRQIAGLWASGGLLYVADSVAASVEILRVKPLCP
jgi:DNA-binding beta-propeller fold protein YncE